MHRYIEREGRVRERETERPSERKRGREAEKERTNNRRRSGGKIDCVRTQSLALTHTQKRKDVLCV